MPMLLFACVCVCVSLCVSESGLSAWPSPERIPATLLLHLTVPSSWVNGSRPLTCLMREAEDLIGGIRSLCRLSGFPLVVRASPDFSLSLSPAAQRLSAGCASAKEPPGQLDGGLGSLPPVGLVCCSSLSAQSLAWNAMAGFLRSARDRQVIQFSLRS